MNKDFPRVIKLLRKERGLRQKEAAEQMGVAQALLSHYENGKRECGLDFLVKAADFYNVSVDYLLGRTNSRTGTVVSEEELPESTVSEKFEGNPAGMGIMLRKKLVTNSLEIIYSLLMKTRNNRLAKAVTSYLQTAVYRAYRMVYSAGGENDENCFAVSVEDVAGASAAKMSIDDIHAKSAAKDGTADERITDKRIEMEFPKQSAALFNVISSAEKDIRKYDD
ncbi:MAG: helix-turn-helix domain-containing protein [Oscillospiraceae bacterium]|nr:helix-turn-helix domain-containing protein [Oscillospiraceae bacterium]